MDYTVRLEQPSEQVIPKLIEALRQQGLQATISFDLRLARAGQAHCDCPYHGQAECTCQLAILLVYDPEQVDGKYRTVTIHGRDQRVWLTLLQNPVLIDGAMLAYEAAEAVIIDSMQSLVDPSQQVALVESRRQSPERHNQMKGSR